MTTTISTTTTTPPGTAGAVARCVVRADAEALLDLLDRVAATSEPGAVHAARVAMRRLRADLRTFRPLLDRDWVEDRRRELDGPYRALAVVRHLDVRAGHLHALTAGVDGLAADAAPLLADLAEVRADALGALRVALATGVPPWLAALADGSLEPPVDPAPASDAHVEAELVLPALLRRPWRHVRDAHAGGGAGDDELRIWSRRCRYAAEATAGTLGPPAVRLAEAAAALHVALGDVHEAAELRAEARADHDAGLVTGRLAKAMRRHADDNQRRARRRSAKAVAAVLTAEDATRTPDAMRRSLAGGGVVWRPVPDGGGLEVVVVHRPRKGDWSLPKGRVKPGEDVAAGARREVEEETGLVCAPGSVLPPVSYVDRRGRRKEVRFWAMEPVALGRRAGDEVDEVRWLPLERAIELVDKRRDREVLASFASATTEEPSPAADPAARAPVASSRG